MNRRMVKAKAARKFYAARIRWQERHPVVIEIRLDFDASVLRAALFGVGEAAREAAAAMRGFGDAVARSRVIDGECSHLAPGQLFAREPDGTRRHLGTTGPITLRLGHDPLPDQRCTCTVTRVVKTDSQGVPRQVDVPGPTCDWCQRQPPPPAPPDCGVCGEPIRPDGMTGTTCGCAPGSRGRTWSPLMCECTGIGPTCGYCRGHGVP